MEHQDLTQSDSYRQAIEQFLLDFANGKVPDTPDLSGSEYFSWLESFLQGIIRPVAMSKSV